MENKPDVDEQKTLDDLQVIITKMKESLTNEQLKVIRTNLFPIYVDLPLGKNVFPYYYGYIDGVLSALIMDLEKFIEQTHPEDLKKSDIVELVRITTEQMEDGLPTILVMPWQERPTTFILIPVGIYYIVTDVFINGESLIQTAINKTKAKFPDEFKDMPTTNFFS